MKPAYSLKRTEFIDKAEVSWQNKLKAMQRELSRLIRQEIIPKLDQEAGRLKTTARNFAILGEMDNLYERFVRTEGEKLAEKYIRETLRLFELNQKYFARQVPQTRQQREAIEREVKEEVYLAIGITATGTIIKQGPLARIISDLRPIQVIKAELSNAISGQLDTNEAGAALRNRVLGTESRQGSLEAHINEQMPIPYQQFDRKVTTVQSDKLGLEHFIYQGGIIRDSRPFCIVRNDKVFTREEIAKFGTAADTYGGYTNKALGEFQGKCPKFGYNPFRDLGGCNCRHSLDPISKELAYRLRPELRPATTEA